MRRRGRRDWGGEAVEGWRRHVAGRAEDERVEECEVDEEEEGGVA